MVTVATFNVENLFARPKVFRSALGEANPELEAFQKVNALFQKARYSDADKRAMVDLLVELDIYRRNRHGAVRRRYAGNPKWAWLRKNRGSFDREPRDPTKDVRITATGRASWIGWVELAVEPTRETAVRMTARVIDDVGADILGVVEAEDRPSLFRFNEELLGAPYAHVMLVDGNDPRGIDVGLMTKAGFPIGSIQSHVDDEDAKGTIFSRDCPVYEVTTPSGTPLTVLVNHFKSQSGGGGQKRARQATRVRQIVDALVAAGRHVVMMGDLNEGPKRGQTRSRISPRSTPRAHRSSTAGCSGPLTREAGPEATAPAA